MNFASHTDALILDLRSNGGGAPDTVAGAANPAGPWPINGDLSITIPFGYIKTVVKEANWEGTGVIPDTEMP